MIDGLTPGDEEDGDGVVVVAHVAVVDGGDVARRRQVLAGDGGARGADAVGVVGRQHPPELGQRRAPVRMFQVVAQAVELAVALGMALLLLEEGRTELVDDRLARVDQRQAVVDGVDGQAVLDGQQPRRLRDDVGQVVDVAVGQRGALGRRQPQLRLGRFERVVHRVVRDARLVVVVVRPVPPKKKNKQTQKNRETSSIPSNPTSTASVLKSTVAIILFHFAVSFSIEWVPFSSSEIAQSSEWTGGFT